jgi:hypothetical protein
MRTRWRQQICPGAGTDVMVTLELTILYTLTQLAGVGNLTVPNLSLHNLAVQLQPYGIHPIFYYCRAVVLQLYTIMLYNYIHVALRKLNVIKILRKHFILVFQLTLYNFSFSVVISIRVQYRNNLLSICHVYWYILFY